MKAAISADALELGALSADLRSSVDDLARQDDLHLSWRASRPEVRLRLHHLDRAIAALEAGQPVMGRAQPLAPAVGR